MQDKSLIVGITGAFGSGKSTAAEFFKSKGFRKIALSSFLEEEAKKRGYKKITRKILQDIGNEWREKFGRGILVKKILEQSQNNKTDKIVIDGIRSIGEIEELRKEKKFILLAIVANRKVRFERVKKIKRRESLTSELFNKLDMRDLGIGEKATGLQVAFCIALADFFISNNMGKKDFIRKLENFLETYE